MPKDILWIFRGNRIFMWSKWKTKSDIIAVLQSIGLSNGNLSSKNTHLFCYTVTYLIFISFENGLLLTYEGNVIWSKTISNC